MFVHGCFILDLPGTGQYLVDLSRRTLMGHRNQAVSFLTLSLVNIMTSLIMMPDESGYYCREITKFLGDFKSSRPPGVF